MRLFFLTIISLFSLSAQSAELVTFSSPEGIGRLERSTAKVDFPALANHFEPQQNKIFCGLASSAIVLNALRIDNKDIKKPQDNFLLSKKERAHLPKGFDPIFERYTQYNVVTKFSKNLSSILGKPLTINGKQINDYGLQLKQLVTLLQENHLNVQYRVVDSNLNERAIREDLITNLKTQDDYVLINYLRTPLGQGNGGHISPVGAYDKESDSFLVMDVNPNAAKWSWVKTSDLIAAMNTFDTVENRGYVLVKEGSKQ